MQCVIGCHSVEFLIRHIIPHLVQPWIMFFFIRLFQNFFRHCNNLFCCLVDQIPVISEKMKTAYGIKSLPVMLVGDMNSRPDTEAYRVLTSALRDARLYSKGDTVDGRYATSPDLRWVESEADYRQDGHVIDYLMISRQITVNNYKMVWTSTNLCPYGEFISDHNAVIVNVGI